MLSPSKFPEGSWRAGEAESWLRHPSHLPRTSSCEAHSAASVNLVDSAGFRQWRMLLSPRSVAVVPFRALQGAQLTRQVTASADRAGAASQETCAALCRELLDLATCGSVVAAERRLHRFAPSLLLGPAEGAMFAAAALPSRFHGAAFRSLLLAAINANDAEKTAKYPGASSGDMRPPRSSEWRMSRV
ncbi:hypothetical protein AK812_SmicGene41320 [Symbiodinium microadriaticum]|uniref:Uncharacterized protein n=1 Tax=Symbiodinium microadriaticum TaxID=2951 RepID=A0A1Q9C6F2_SYMMI|nr:hypothetical protein AK812_SmicGene41320 [Symbiodinium microadriaticum]